jgi:hypothetical protein
MIDPITTKAVAQAERAIAETGGKAIDAGREFGGFLARILGNLPHDTVGLLGGDLLHEVRLRNLDNIKIRTEKILVSRRINDPSPVSPSLAIPLLHAAQDEGHVELQVLWAQLLANAMDPSRANGLRIEFIETLKRFNPIDALVLKLLIDTPSSMHPNTRDFLATNLRCSSAAIEVSFRHLDQLGCTIYPAGSIPNTRSATSFGLELFRACAA